MIEDKRLLWKFKQGSPTALQRIYEKYRGYLLTLATALLNDVHSAEDVVHDFFVSFAQSGSRIRLEGSLKWYLAACVTNRVRDRIRARKRKGADLEDADGIASCENQPETEAMRNEEMQFLQAALDQLPYDQREAVVLHTRGQMKFKAIAQLQEVSIKTVQSRYRYGLEKLKILLNGQVEP